MMHYLIEKLISGMYSENAVSVVRDTPMCKKPPSVINGCPHWGYRVKISECFGNFVLAINGCPR